MGVNLCNLCPVWLNHILVDWGIILLFLFIATTQIFRSLSVSMTYLEQKTEPNLVVLQTLVITISVRPLNSLDRIQGPSGG